MCERAEGVQRDRRGRVALSAHGGHRPRQPPSQPLRLATRQVLGRDLSPRRPRQVRKPPQEVPRPEGRLEGRLRQHGTQIIHAVPPTCVVLTSTVILSSNEDSNFFRN